MAGINDYNDKITQWSGIEGGEEYLKIDRKIQFLSDYLYADFEPTFGAYPDFYSRLAKWITNVTSDDDQKLLFKLVPRIFYLGREEFNCLHRTAYNTAIKNWLIEIGNLTFDNQDYLKYLSQAMEDTWFCPVTDSFRINQFYHLNQISTKHTFRPDWRSLRKFGDINKIILYIIKNNVKQIVLLEDFVGSGTQCVGPIKFACDLITEAASKQVNLKILFVPLIIFPVGLDKINKSLVSNYPNFSIKPIIEVKLSEIINKEAEDSNDELKPFVDMIERSFTLVKGDTTMPMGIEKFGYKNTGGLVVMCTNTPNNSLPIIFYESNSWSPLFKRHFRD